MIGTIRRCKYGATIDKYVGDAIIMFFGDPATRGVKEDALACVQMAIAINNVPLRTAPRRLLEGRLRSSACVTRAWF